MGVKLDTCTKKHTDTQTHKHTYANIHIHANTHTRTHLVKLRQEGRDIAVGFGDGGDVQVAVTGYVFG
jgi:hypothetical protein